MKISHPKLQRADSIRETDGNALMDNKGRETESEQLVWDMQVAKAKGSVPPELASL